MAASLLVNGIEKYIILISRIRATNVENNKLSEVFISFFSAVPVESKINVHIMSQSLTSKIHIFITVDLPTISGYFNPHDPSPLYKKELNQKFEEYILNAVHAAKRYSAIFYKLNCPGAVDRQYAEPLMFAIHRHFALQEAIQKEVFNKFKRRNFRLLLISCIFVMICQALIFLIHSEHEVEDFLKVSKTAWMYLAMC